MYSLYGQRSYTCVVTLWINEVFADSFGNPGSDLLDHDCAGAIILLALRRVLYTSWLSDTICELDFLVLCIVEKQHRPRRSDSLAGTGAHIGMQMMLLLPTQWFRFGVPTKCVLGRVCSRCKQFGRYQFTNQYASEETRLEGHLRYLPISSPHFSTVCLIPNSENVHASTWLSQTRSVTLPNGRRGCFLSILKLCLSFLSFSSDMKMT